MLCGYWHWRRYKLAYGIGRFRRRQVTTVSDRQIDMMASIAAWIMVPTAVVLAQRFLSSLEGDQALANLFIATIASSTALAVRKALLRKHKGSSA